MDGLKQALKALKTGISEEIQALEKLTGKRLLEFAGIFNVPETSEIYFNKFNMIIISPELNEILGSYFKKKDLILRFEFPEYNANIWVYQYFNDQLFSNYLNPYSED